MKTNKFIIVLALTFLCLLNGLSQAIRVNSGKVGINGAPYSTYPINVNGTLRSTDILITNDLIIYDDILGAHNIQLDGYLYNGSASNGKLELLPNYTLKITGGPETDKALYVNGNGHINGTFTWSSDGKLKKNIRPIDSESILEKISRIEGKQYQFKNKEELEELHNSGAARFSVDTVDIYGEAEKMYRELQENNNGDYAEIKNMRDEDRNMILGSLADTLKKYEDYSNIVNNGSLGILINTPKYDNKEHYGLLAENVMEEFPELVDLDSTTGLYGVDYVGFIPILLEGMKAQDQYIQKLESEIAEIKKYMGINIDNDDPKNLKSQDIPIADEKEKPAELYQNNPNPFNNQTLIKVYLPNSVKDAQLIIFDMRGVQIKKVEITQTGYVDIALNGNEMYSGMYMYTLIADGKEIDTKRMIITK